MKKNKNISIGDEVAFCTVNTIYLTSQSIKPNKLYLVIDKEYYMFPESEALSHVKVVNEKGSGVWLDIVAGSALTKKELRKKFIDNILKEQNQ